MAYEVKINTLSDAHCDVEFEISPPIRFLTEKARQDFGVHVLHLVNRRAHPAVDVNDERLFGLTHDSADGSATHGYAKLPELRYGMGKEIFAQALFTALNGTIPPLYPDGKAIWE